MVKRKGVFVPLGVYRTCTSSGDRGGRVEKVSRKASFMLRGGEKPVYVWLDPDDPGIVILLEKIEKWAEREGRSVYVVPVPLRGRGSVARAAVLHCAGSDALDILRGMVRNRKCDVAKYKTKLSWSLVPVVAGDVRSLPAIVVDGTIYYGYPCVEKLARMQSSDPAHAP